MEDLKEDAFVGLSASKTMFQGFCNLEWLQTHYYITCCARPQTVDSSNCISPRYSTCISSCEQFIRVGFLAQMIWYMALFSVTANLYVMYYRVKEKRKGNNSYGTFVLNLSISIFLMGVYLFIIAITDMRYRNIYGFNDSRWRSSAICTIAGLQATTSSEASVLFIFINTIERYMALWHWNVHFLQDCSEVKNYEFSFNNRLVDCYIVFIYISTVCIFLPLTIEKVPGWNYSTFLFIGFNLITFLAIIIGQLLIYA